MGLDVDDDRTLQIDEFVVGCMRIAGGAKTVDVEMLLEENKRLLKHFKKHTQRINERVDLIKSQMLMAIRESHVLHQKCLDERLTSTSLVGEVLGDSLVMRTAQNSVRPNIQLATS